MFTIIGIVVVFAAVVGGYLMEHGNLRVLVQPSEVVIIAGAAIGTVLIANPLFVLKRIGGGVAGVFGGSKFTKQKYLDTLKMMFELFHRARKIIVPENELKSKKKKERERVAVGH